MKTALREIGHRALVTFLCVATGTVFGVIIGAATGITLSFK